MTQNKTFLVTNFDVSRISLVNYGVIKLGNLTHRQAAWVEVLFPFEYSLNLTVLSNLFLSSYKELRIYYQFQVL